MSIVVITLMNMFALGIALYLGPERVYEAGLIVVIAMGFSALYFAILERVK